jgi:predicted dehydrogenase
VVTRIETGDTSLRQTADYIGILGKTRSGAAFTAEIEGGVQPENVCFTLDVRGSDGWLRLTSNHPYGFQAGNLRLTSNVAFDAPDAPAISNDTETAINVGEVYARLVRDLREGTWETPGFQHALHNARVVEAVMHSARRGVRQRIPRRDARPGRPQLTLGRRRGAAVAALASAAADQEP